MPKGKCKRIKVNSEIFRLILKKRGTSINKISSELGWSDKTIRTALKEGFLEGRLIKISQELDVCQNYLTGDLYNKSCYPNEASYIESIDHFPFLDNYYHHFWGNELDNNIIETISMFGCPKEKYTSLSPIKKIEIKESYYSDIMGIIDKLFESDEDHFPYSVKIQFAMEEYKCKVLGIDD